MRVPLKSITLITLLLTLSACSSWASVADYIPGNIEITLKFSNYDIGTTYTISDTGDSPYDDAGIIDGLGSGQPTGADGPEDGWGLLYLTGIYAGHNTTAAENVLWLPNTAKYGNSEISGLFWGGIDEYLGQKTTADFKSQYLGMSGIKVALWEDIGDSKTLFTAAPGPGGRTNPSDMLPWYQNGDGSRVATDGNLIWTLESTPGFSAGFINSPTSDFQATYSVDIAGPGIGEISGGGGFWANTSTITSGTGSFIGSLNGLFGAYYTGVGPSLIANFTNTSPSYDWGVGSQDPAFAMATPELSSGLLMLLGIVPIGIGWRRRKTA